MNITIIGDSEDINFMILQKVLYDMNKDKLFKIKIADLNYEGRVMQMSWEQDGSNFQRYHTTKLQVFIDEERIPLDTNRSLSYRQ